MIQFDADQSVLKLKCRHQPLDYVSINDEVVSDLPWVAKVNFKVEVPGSAVLLTRDQLIQLREWCQQRIEKTAL